MLEQAALKEDIEAELKAETSDEGFHDPRDEVEQSGAPTALAGEPPVFEDAEEYQPSLQEELLQRAAQAVASERKSPSPSPYRDEADFDEDSDL
eukprot:6299493-Amphidinium_carterae.4